MKRILTTLFVCAITLATMAQTCLNQSILFGKDSINVSESQMGRLELMAAYIKNHPTETIIIGGFTSNKTIQSEVQKLCDKRAEAVKKVLMEKYLIPSNRLLAIGAGVCTKYDDPAMNEIVEFFITGK